MKDSVFLSGITEIYAAFGKNMPSLAIRNAIFRRLADKPDSFMAYAQERVCNLESLPSNLGRYMELDLWPDYRDSRPELANYNQLVCCALCDPSLPGFRRVYSVDYQEIYLWKCPCNTNPRYAAQLSWTDEMIHKKALHTHADFLAWAQGRKLRMPGKALNVIGKEFRTREKHEDYVRKMEEAIPW